MVRVRHLLSGREDIGSVRAYFNVPAGTFVLGEMKNVPGGKKIWLSLTVSGTEKICLGIDL